MFADLGIFSFDPHGKALTAAEEKRDTYNVAGAVPDPARRATCQRFTPVRFKGARTYKYMAANVVFFVYPATLDEMSDSRHTKAVGGACVR